MSVVGSLDGVALPAAAPPAAGAGEVPARVDDTAESSPDTAATVADQFSKHVEVALLAQQAHQQELQTRLDRMKADFNQAQEERSEMLREMNALRDMALEQAKKDDEVLKKYIAMI
jgi:flagellar motility protein MotE (MotC chaperone)